jgi:SET domain-containing protein
MGVHPLSWLVDVEFRESAVHGMGVYARKPIAAGTRLWRVDAATRISGREALAGLSLDRLAYALHGGYYHRGADALVWYEDGMQYMNHAPGALANAGLTFWPPVEDDHTVALRDIAAGEELFEDYGFWADSGVARGHWLEPFYRAACPGHLAFLRGLEREPVAA